MKNIARFTVATAASMLSIAVGVAVSYVACDGGAGVLPTERASGKNLLEGEAYRPAPAAAESSIVYFTKDVSRTGLKAVYDALNLPPPAGAKTAVKLSTGEDGSNYLRDTLIKDFIQSLPGAHIVECNVAYASIGMTSRRGRTDLHKQLIIDHGFAAIAPTIIMDSARSLPIPVYRTPGVTTHHLDTNYVGEAFKDYDYYVILSHFKGHGIAGLGGAIKNISIGIASIEGKNWIHTAGKSRTSILDDRGQNPFQESMAEAGKSVVDYLKKDRDGQILYINVMNNISIDCDCIANSKETPQIKDIGILASTDPVALDWACVELVKNAAGNADLMNRISQKNGELMIRHGEKIGLGSLTYKRIDLDNATSVKTPERVSPSMAAMSELAKSK